MSDKKPKIKPEPYWDTAPPSEIYIDVYTADNPSPEEFERRVNAAIASAERSLSRARATK